LEQEQSDFEHGFKTDYMTALSTAHAAASLFVRSGKTEAKIILVGSTLSFIGLVGYAQYAPMKWAIRGLAESLRSEFKLYKGLDVHCYFPGTILSPGYEEENKTKPAITVQIEGGDANGLTPAQCAKALLKGVQRGQFYITSDFDTELMRAGTATCGTVPGNNLILDRVKALICLIGVSSWRIFTADSAIEKHGREHRSKLKLSSDAS
jgi:3-dehydrosphinganine reductase